MSDSSKRVAFNPRVTGYPKPMYDPMRSHTVHRPSHYAGGIVTSQEMMLQQLRWVRQQLDREDRELKQAQEYLYKAQAPRKYTPYNYQPGFNDYEY